MWWLRWDLDGRVERVEGVMYGVNIVDGVSKMRWRIDFIVWCFGERVYRVYYIF